MIVDSLKKSILKYAITGKLSTSEANDSNIFDTFEEIQNNRKELFEKKIITKQQYNILKNDDKYCYEIPSHWMLTQIGYLGYVVGGGTPRTDIVEYWGNDYSWITPKDMKNYNDKYVDIGNRSISKKGLENSSAQLIPKGSILCSSRAPIGYLGISSNELTTNQGFKTLVPLGNLNAEYIYYYLMARVEDLKKSGDGTTFSEISGSDLGKFHIALPPIEEQERIVEKIESLFAKLDEIKPIEKTLNQLKFKFSSDMKNSLYQAAMTGKLSTQNYNENAIEFLNKLEQEQEKTGFIKMKNITPVSENTIPYKIPDNWIWKKIGDLLEINLGFTYRPTYVDNGYMFLSVKDISSGYIDFENVKYISEEEYNKASYGSKPRKGDILFGRVGTIGVPQIVETDVPFCIFVSLGFFRDYTNMLNKKFICYWMYSSLFKKQVADNVSGTAQINLNSNWLKNFYIPIPPVEEQQRIVDKLEQLLPLCDVIDTLINK